jgi:hypothetical protein
MIVMYMVGSRSRMLKRRRDLSFEPACVIDDDSSQRRGIGLDDRLFPSAVLSYLLVFVGHIALMSLRCASRNTQRFVERHVRRTHVLYFDVEEEVEPFVGARGRAFRAVCTYARALATVGVITPYALCDTTIALESARRAYNRLGMSMDMETQVLRLVAQNRNTLRNASVHPSVRTPAVVAAYARCPRLEIFTMRGTGQEGVDETLVRSALDVFQHCDELRTVNSSNWAAAHQGRLMCAALAHSSTLNDLLVDTIPADLFSLLGTCVVVAHAASMGADDRPEAAF